MPISRKTHASVDAYMASFPPPVRAIMQKIRKMVLGLSSDIEETISYGIPTYRLNGTNLVHFAGYPHHIGFYPTPSGIKKFSKELSRFETSKGAIRFPLDKPLPFGLMKRMVQFRVRTVQKEALVKKASKKKR